MKRLCLLLALLALFPGLALAEAPQLEDRGLDLGTSSVHWPQVTGLEDEETQTRLNTALRQMADAEALTGRMALLMTSPSGLTATWKGFIQNGLLSCAAHAEGPLHTQRVEERWGAAVFDLSSGEKVPLSAFFTTPAEGEKLLQTLLTDTVAPGLSAHLNAANLLPLPEDYAAGPDGLTFYYPTERLTTLSGRAGTLRLYWSEVSEALNLAPDSPAVRLGAEQALTLSAENARALRAAAAEGELPLWPVRLGESAAEAIGRYGLGADPDLYLGGRYVELQDDRFRGALLMTDALGEDIQADSPIRGLRADRFALFGLRPGLDQAEVRACLGQPDSTVTLDADQAEALRLQGGVSDYYLCPPYRLRLHYTPQGKLVTLILSE